MISSSLVSSTTSITSFFFAAPPLVLVVVVGVGIVLEIFVGVDGADFNLFSLSADRVRLLPTHTSTYQEEVNEYIIWNDWLMPKERMLIGGRMPITNS